MANSVEEYEGEVRRAREHASRTLGIFVGPPRTGKDNLTGHPRAWTHTTTAGACAANGPSLPRPGPGIQSPAEVLFCREPILKDGRTPPAGMPAGPLRSLLPNPPGGP